MQVRQLSFGCWWSTPNLMLWRTRELEISMKKLFTFNFVFFYKLFDTIIKQIKLTVLLSCMIQVPSLWWWSINPSLWLFHLHLYNLNFFQNCFNSLLNVSNLLLWITNAWCNYWLSGFLLHCLRTQKPARNYGLPSRFTWNWIAGNCWIVGALNPDSSML